MLHKHQCPNTACGKVWEHDPNHFHSQEEHDAGHRCPDCGTKQYSKHYAAGEEDPLISLIRALICFR